MKIQQVNNKNMQPAFKASFNLKFLKGGFDIPTEMTDAFVKRAKIIGNSDDSINVLVNHELEDGFDSIQVVTVSSVGKKLDVSKSKVATARNSMKPDSSLFNLLLFDLMSIKKATSLLK